MFGCIKKLKHSELVTKTEDDNEVCHNFIQKIVWLVPCAYNWSTFQKWKCHKSWTVLHYDNSKGNILEKRYFSYDNDTAAIITINMWKFSSSKIAHYSCYPRSRSLVMRAFYYTNAIYDGYYRMSQHVLTLLIEYNCLLSVSQTNYSPEFCLPLLPANYKMN